MAQENKYPKKIPASPDNTAMEVYHKESRMVRLPDGTPAQFVKMEIQIPPDLVYYIDKDRGGFLASVYHIIAREMGIAWTENTILEKTEDMVRLQVRNTFLSTKGAVIPDTTVVELNAWELYQEARLKWMPMKWDNELKRMVVDENAVKRYQEQGFLKDEIQYDEETGVPIRIKRKLPIEKERELQLNLLTLRKNLLSKAETVAHRKLTQRACGYNGIKMPDQSQEGWEKKLKLPIYAFISSTGEVLSPEDIHFEERDDLLEDEIDDPPKVQATSKTEQPKTQQKTEATKTVTEDKKAPPVEKTEKQKTEQPSGAAEAKKEYFCRNKACGKKVVKKIYHFQGKGMCMDCQKLNPEEMEFSANYDPAA